MAKYNLNEVLKQREAQKSAARQAKEQAEKAYKDELETKRRLKEQEERERIFQETFGWI